MAKECPKCGAELEFEEADPSIGIICSFYFCPSCDHDELAEDDDGSDYTH